MSSDLIALVVAITLGVAVVGLGWRRNLGDVTREWLPRFGKAPKPATATAGSFDGGQGRRRLSPRQRRFLIWSYLFIGLGHAGLAALSAGDRLWHVISAALFALGAAGIALKRLPFLGESTL